MTSDSDQNRKASKSRKTPPSSEEDTSGGQSSDGIPLKKGPWTAAEDAILVEYVMKHGEGNWNAVQKYSGLQRCGKSCRLRWANHLRPDLKKGAFTQEEENRIIQLHSKMGNKWARMAAELPGRTDNEIKNFWNTRLKRLQRAGLPIYPPEIRVKPLSDSQESDEDMVSFQNGDTNHSDQTSQTDSFEIPNVEFKNLELDQELLNTWSSELLDQIPTGSLLQKGMSSSSSSHGYALVFPTSNPHKRLREMEPQLGSSIGSTTTTSNGLFPSFDDQFQEEYSPFGRSGHIQSLWSPSSHEPDLNINQNSSIDVIPDSTNALINGNDPGYPEPFSDSMKLELELPSLQYSGLSSQVTNWSTKPSSPLPSIDSVDTLIQSPLIDHNHDHDHEHSQSNCPSPQDSGLLEAVVYESKFLKEPKNKSSYQQVSETSNVAGDGFESSSQNVFGTKWVGFRDPISPLSHSAASVFIDYSSNPTSGGCSSAEPQSPETIPGCKSKLEIDLVSEEQDEEKKKKKDVPYELQYLEPDDGLLDTYWLSHHIGCGMDQTYWLSHHLGCGMDQTITDEDFGAFLGDDDLSSEFKQVADLPSESNQSFGVGSSTCDNVSSSFQVPKSAE